MPRKPTTPRNKPDRKKPAARASAGTIREDALYEEIADLLRTMPNDWRKQYRSGRDKLSASGGPMLPDTPSPEQAMLLIGITAGGNPSGDSPFGPNRVPAAVRQAAMKGVRLSHANNYGAWDFIGIARAIELVIVPSVSDTTFKRMGLYLFRHKKDALGANFGNDAKPSRGYMAWLNWGGDPAVPWTRAFERNPRPSRVMYHASPVHNRAAIRATGLHPGFSASYGPPGVYMFRYDYFATSYHPHYLSEPMDVWEVETSGIKIHPDPEDPEAAVYTERDIPRTRVKLLGTYLDDEEVTVSDAEAARAPEGYMQEEWRTWWAACSARAASVTGLWEKWLRTLPEKASMMKTVPRRNPDLDLPPPPPMEVMGWLPQAAFDPNLTLAPRAMEALTPDALTVKRGKRGGRLPAKALGVYHDDGYRFRIVLVDPKALRRGAVEPRDILGYASAYHLSGENAAKISDAAAEPGYGYLLYALMADYVGKSGAKELRGSTAQTKYAKKFWEKQPKGVLKPLTPKEFRAQFGTTARSIQQGGERLVDAFVGKGALKDDVRRAEEKFLDLGLYYFGRYYGVAISAARMRLEEIARPISPRAGAAALSRVPTTLRDLALVEVGGVTHLLNVPQGTVDLGVGNMITRISEMANYTHVSPVDRYLNLPFYSDIQPILAHLHDPQTLSITDRRIIQRMRDRGGKIRDALVAAGIPEYRHEDFLDHLADAVKSYYPFARPEPHEVLALTHNPRRFPSSVRIFMPV